MVALAKSSSWLRRLSNFPENRELYRAWTFARLMVLWSSPSGGMREGQSVLKYATSRRVCPSLLLITPPKRELRSDHTWATEKTQVADAPVASAARFRASPACRPCGDHPKAVVLHLISHSGLEGSCVADVGGGAMNPVGKGRKLDMPS